MGNLLLVWRTLLGLVPVIIDLVKAVEMPGNGQAKLEAVVGLVLAAFDVLPEEVRKLIPVETVKLFVAKATSVVVSLLNLVGVFKK